MFQRRLCILFLAVTFTVFLGGVHGCGTEATVTEGQTKIVVNGQTVDLKETEKEVVRQKYQTKSAPRVIIDVFNGKITVAAGADDAVEAEVTKIAAGETKDEAKANLKLIDVQMKQEGDTIRITARRPNDKPTVLINSTVEDLKKQFAVRSADAVVRVPAGAALELKTAYGDVHVSGIAGRVEAVTSSGAIAVNNGKGEVKLTSSYGNLTIAGKNTAVTASTSSGEISVKDAQGPVKISSGYGAVKVAGAATVDAETKSGDITIQGVVGDVRAKSGYGKLVVEQAPAGATLETSSGDIQLKAARGKVKATSGYGKIDAEVEDAIVTVSSKSGDVHVRGRLADGDHALQSGYGAVTLVLPADSQFRLNAKTNYGKVTTGFAVETSGKKTDNQIVGKVGAAPKTALTITTSSGDIEVRKK